MKWCDWHLLHLWCAGAYKRPNQESRTVYPEMMYSQNALAHMLVNETNYHTVYAIVNQQPCIQSRQNHNRLLALNLEALGSWRKITSSFLPTSLSRNLPYWSPYFHSTWIGTSPHPPFTSLPQQVKFQGFHKYTRLVLTLSWPAKAGALSFISQ